MFRVRKSREQLLTEQFEQRLEERDRLVRILAEQVEYLRAQLNMPTATVGMALAPPRPQESAPEQRMDLIPAFGGDSRDELDAMRQAGVITEDEFQRALSVATSNANIIE